jgi:Mg2+ and Co2+ transporter CorA
MTLPDTWNLPPSLRERLGREAGPQRMMLEEGHLLLVLHKLPKAGETQRHGIMFWRSPAGAWTASEGEGLAGLAAHFETFSRALDRLGAAEVKSESAREYHDILTELAPITRTARHAHETLQKARLAMPDEDRLIDQRDAAAAVERSAELLLQDANYGLTFTAARRAEEEADAARRLNLLAAIFLPLSTLAGVFGMTMKSGTGIEDHPWGFWEVVLSGLVIGTVLAIMLGRRKHS